MPITITDRAPLEKVRRLADGRLAATAKFARAGCYTYSGHEVGRPDLHAVTVYRPESEVFAADAMASFAHKTITIGHPPEGVTADNWKNHAAGWTEGKVVRDGEHIEIPLMLADAAAVAAYDAGTRELSAGYSCDLVWGDGVAPDGTRYAAKQTSIRGNHIALVAQGRAGSTCRIGDAKAAEPPTSIDETFRAIVAEAAKRSGVKASEYLARLPRQEVEKLAEQAATTFVAAAGGAGVSAAFAMDSMRAAAMGLSAPSTPLDKAMQQARTIAQLAVIDADPRKAWRDDPALASARAVRDAARMFSQG